MPPRSPAASMRQKVGPADDRNRDAPTDRNRQHSNRCRTTATPTSPTFAEMERAPAVAQEVVREVAGPRGRDGFAFYVGGEEPLLPSLFRSEQTATPTAASDISTETRSETSSSSGSSPVSEAAMMALSSREDGEDCDDEMIIGGAFIPALLYDRGGSPLSAEAAAAVTEKVNPNNRSGGDVSRISNGSSGQARRRGHYWRALSSQCLEGLDWGDAAGDGAAGGKPHRRERSESEPRLLDSPRPRRFNHLFDYSADLLDCSGTPSDREHSSSLYRQYSNEASAPPPQVLQGWKMNCVALDKRSWLEVRDKQHRYGKNLRLYYKEWDRRGKPGTSFFAWLSTPGVQLAGCPRHELETDVVHYCPPEEVVNYALSLEVTHEGQAILRTSGGELVDCGPSAWLFVLRDQTIFAADKKTDPPRFHHSSFFGGGYVEAAGMLVAEKGVLKTLYPHSGHYRPTNQHLQGLLKFLRGLGVDLSALQVDAQRVHKVARPDKRTSYPRVRKMDNPFMVSARYLLDFFEAKYLAWSTSHFDELRRKVNERHDRLRREFPDDVVAETPEVFFGIGVGANRANSFSSVNSESDRASFSWETAAVTGMGDARRTINAYPSPAAGGYERSDSFGVETDSCAGPGGDADGDGVDGGGGVIDPDIVGGGRGGGFAAVKPPVGGGTGDEGGGRGGGGRPAEEHTAGGESRSVACPPTGP